MSLAMNVKSVTPKLASTVAVQVVLSSVPTSSRSKLAESIETIAVSDSFVPVNVTRGGPTVETAQDAVVIAGSAGGSVSLMIWYAAAALMRPASSIATNASALSPSDGSVTGYSHPVSRLRGTISTPLRAIEIPAGFRPATITRVALVMSGGKGWNGIDTAPTLAGGVLPPDTATVYAYAGHPGSAARQVSNPACRNAAPVTVALPADAPSPATT